MLYVWAIAVGLYVVGISWFARNESSHGHRKRRVKPMGADPIVLLFIVPLIALGYLIHGDNLDPIRVFLANVVGLLAGGVAFFCILQMRKPEDGAIGKGVSLLAGICAVDATMLSFHAPLLVGPCVLLGAIAHILQKKFAAT